MPSNIQDAAPGQPDFIPFDTSIFRGDRVLRVGPNDYKVWQEQGDGGSWVDAGRSGAYYGKIPILRAVAGDNQSREAWSPTPFSGGVAGDGGYYAPQTQQFAGQLGGGAPQAGMFGSMDQLNAAGASPISSKASDSPTMQLLGAALGPLGGMLGGAAGGLVETFPGSGEFVANAATGASAGGAVTSGAGGGSAFGSTIDVAGQLPPGSFPGQTAAWTAGNGVNWGNLNSMDVQGQLPLNSFPGQFFSTGGLQASLGVPTSIPGSGNAGGNQGGTVNIPGLGNVPISLLGAGAGALLGGLGGSARPAGTTTTVQDIPEWLKPYVTSNINAAQQVRDQYIPQNPLLPAAQQQALQTINGQYLDPATNPYLQGTYNQAAKSVTDSYLSTTQPRTDALFGRSGNAFGDNSGYQETVARNQFGLGQNLSNLANDIYGGNYQQERARQTGMVTAAPGFVQQQTQAAFQPFTSFNSTLPNSQSTTQPYFQNLLGGALTGALGGYAFGSAFGK